MKCWMRILKIELISQVNGKVLVFGNNTKQTTRNYMYGVPAPTCNDNLNIQVSGAKYPSALKDKGTVTIYNLTYATISEIILGKFYKIKIYAGYQSWNEEPFLIFNGSVAYISQKVHSNHDTECYIIFTSDVVANYSQNRMNLTLNSGINLYAAINYMLYTQGISNAHLDENLKNAFLNEIYNLYGTASTILDSATLSNTGDYTISVDGTDGTVIDVTTVKGKRFIKIDTKYIPIGGSNPKVTSSGLAITLLPICNFKVGDVLCIDNKILDESINDAENVSSTFNTNYMDTNGYYMILQINYELANRGDSFHYNITARALDLIKNLTSISE